MADILFTPQGIQSVGSVAVTSSLFSVTAGSGSQSTLVLYNIEENTEALDRVVGVDAFNRAFALTQANITASRAITASYALTGDWSQSVTQSFSNLSVWDINHNLEDKQVMIQAFDQYDEMIIPGTTRLIDENNARLIFPVPVSGYAISTRGGLRVIQNDSGGGGTTLQTGAYYPITSSWSLTSSYALNAGNTLQTGAYYPITSSWSNTSSISLTSSYVTASNVYGTVTSASYALTASYLIGFNGTSGTSASASVPYQHHHRYTTFQRLSL